MLTHKKLLSLILALVFSPSVLFAADNQIAFPGEPQSVSEMIFGTVKVEIMVNPKVVHGRLLGSVREFKEGEVLISNFRYLGHEGNVIKVRLETLSRNESGTERPLDQIILSYYSDTGTFLLVPSVFQGSRYCFRVEPKPGGAYVRFENFVVTEEAKSEDAA